MIETVPVESVEPIEAKAKIVPGTFVTYPSRKGSFGTVISVREGKVVIVWSNAGHDPFSNFVFPAMRRIFSPTIAPQLVSVQPMTLPKGLVFYLDYTYGSGSK